MIERILVPTDGSELSEQAADYAIRLAGEVKASVDFISVVDVLMPTYAFESDVSFNPEIPEITEQLTAVAGSFVDKLKAKAEAAGIEAAAGVVSGNPWEEILSEADRRQSDLIVMGSHGHRALAAAVMGSVAINVIHGAKIPVTVIPVPGK